MKCTSPNHLCLFTEVLHRQLSDNANYIQEPTEVSQINWMYGKD